MPSDCDPWPGKTNAMVMLDEPRRKLLRSVPVADYSHPAAECSTNRESRRGPVKMRVDDDQRCAAAHEMLVLLEPELRDEAAEQNPTVPAAPRDMCRAAGGHDRVQSARGAHVPADAGAEPPQARTDRE